MGTNTAQRAEGNFAFNPDYAIPPGETLEEALDELGMSQSEFARRTDRPEKTINEIIKGKAAITAETAHQFERVTGIPSSMWLSLENNYRSALIRQSERIQLQANTSWLDGFPFRALAKRGLVADATDSVDRIVELLRFFGVATVEAWNNLWAVPQVAYRHATTFTSDDKALAAWLRWGELEAQKIECESYERAKFQIVMKEIRRLTRLGPVEAWDTMVELCASAGVALVHTRPLPGTHVSGATRWLSPTKAILQVSFRYLTDDQLWFTIFHEAAHILFHSKRERFVDSEFDDGVQVDDLEEEANKWAAEFLVPPRAFRMFVEQGEFDVASIEIFARSQGVAAGIIAGQLQKRDLLSPARASRSKRHYKWPED